MTHDDFISIVRQPENVKVEFEPDLRELVERYPYFVASRFLNVKALQHSQSIHYGANLKIASIYCSNRRSFYYYLYPDKLPSTEPYLRNKSGKSSGDYFEMINMIESDGGDTKQSLKNLAERLKSARAMVINSENKLIKNTTKINLTNSLEIDKENESLKSNSELNNEVRIVEISENNAKKLIIEHKYKEAIEILRALNLNNPKKSVYFADQIRFLEKVIANSKK